MSFFHGQNACVVSAHAVTWAEKRLEKKHFPYVNAGILSSMVNCCELTHIR